MTHGKETALASTWRGNSSVSVAGGIDSAADAKDKAQSILAHGSTAMKSNSDKRRIGGSMLIFAFLGVALVLGAVVVALAL